MSNPIARAAAAFVCALLVIAGVSFGAAMQRADYPGADSRLHVEDGPNAVLKATVKLYVNDYSHGSGVVIDADRGLILTNHHVARIFGNQLVTIKFQDDQIVYGRVLYKSNQGSGGVSDWAVVRVEESYLHLVDHEAPLVDRELTPGERVFALGSPMDDEFTVVEGRVFNHQEGGVQVNIDVYPGNSGGPLIDEDGNVVGLIWGMAAIPGLGHLGMGIAVPTTELCTFLECR